MNRLATCHPDRPHHAKGLCSACYRLRAQRNSWTVTEHGITDADYLRLLAEQGGACAICGEPPADGSRLYIDHDHETREIRGLLCVKCNIGLGGFRDRVELLGSAVAYLARPATGLFSRARHKRGRKRIPIRIERLERAG